MREKHMSAEAIISRTRITPAYAGKTAACRRSGSVGRDHPRVCGKNSVLSRAVALMLGSPPRMREKL